MAKRLTEEDKICINELYLQIGTYSGVAKETGFAPTTVKKYIIKDYKPADNTEKIVLSIKDIPEEVDLNPFIESDNLGDFCELSQKEEQEMEILWKELKI